MSEPPASVPPAAEGEAPREPGGDERTARRLHADRLASLAALAGGMSHEMDNVLTGMQLVLKVLEKGARSAEERQALAMLEQLAREGSEVVRQFHWFSRAVAGEATVFDLRHLVANLRSLVRAAAPATSLIASYMRDLWPVTGQPLLVYQLLLGLCEEVRRGQEQPGTLQLEASNVLLEGSSAAVGAGSRPGAFVLVRIRLETPGAVPTPAPPLTSPAVRLAAEPGRLQTIVDAQGGFFAAADEGAPSGTIGVYLPAALPVRR
jgi:two-component system cell cycle sensor histidine kinase/response regulator CckA